MYSFKWICSFDCNLWSKNYSTKNDTPLFIFHFESLEIDKIKTQFMRQLKKEANAIHIQKNYCHEKLWSDRIKRGSGSESESTCDAFRVVVFQWYSTQFTSIRKQLIFSFVFFPNFMPQDDRDTTRNTQQDNKITKPFSVQPNSTNHMLWIWWFIYNFVVVDNHITAALSYVWKKIGRKTCVRKSIQKSFNIVVVAPFTRVFLVCNWRTLINVNYFWSIDCNRPRNLFPFHLSIESFHSKRVIYFTPLTKEHEKKNSQKFFFFNYTFQVEIF